MWTRARFSKNQSTVLREPEHGSPRTRARFSENQSTVLPEPEHGSPRTKARFSENQSTVLREPRFSENRSTPKLENRSTSQLEHGSPRTGAHLSWRTREHLRTSPSFLRSPCSPRAPNLLHVLPARLVGWNDLWWRSTWYWCRGSGQACSTPDSPGWIASGKFWCKFVQICHQNLGWVPLADGCNLHNLLMDTTCSWSPFRVQGDGCLQQVWPFPAHRFQSNADSDFYCHNLWFILSQDTYTSSRVRRSKVEMRIFMISQSRI